MPLRVSLCMIVKNEEVNLAECLGPATELVSEIIVVDTGSTDATKAVAARFGARVFDFPWCDDFSAARNESLRHATGEWIFWLDADDRLDELNRRQLASLFAQLPDENAVYMMSTRSVLRSGTSTVADQARLFRNDPQIRWRYRVHEQIALAAMELGGVVRHTSIVIEHAGYRNAEVQVQKWRRNLRLLQLDEAERPQDPAVWFYLGSTYRSLGDHDAATSYFERIISFDRRATTYSMPYLPRVRHFLATTYLARGEAARAESLWLACTAEDPQYGPAWQNLGGLYIDQQRWLDAERLAATMAGDRQRELDTLVLRARIFLGKREFAAARAFIEQAIALHPAAIWPREVLSHILMYEGVDWVAAERALRDILALDPHNSSALQNLETLRLHRERLRGGPS